MADIQPNAQGKVQRARKRLRRHLQQLQTADTLTAGQRDQLFVAVLTDLTRIQLVTLNQHNEEQES